MIIFSPENEKQIISNKLNNASKRISRAFDTLENLLRNNENIVSGEDALLIYNTYGIDVIELKILFYSHGLKIDENEFIELLSSQKEQYSRMKQCKKDL